MTIWGGPDRRRVSDDEARLVLYFFFHVGHGTSIRSGCVRDTPLLLEKTI